MKKILLFASAVAVLFSSCSTDSTQDVIGIEAKNGTISATAAYQQEETRTHLAGKSVVWSKGDAIGVYAQGTSQVQYGLTSGEDAAIGTFAGNSNYLENGKAVFAYYPFDKGAVINHTNKTVELEIMAKQTYKAASTFDAAQAPGVAYVAEVEDKENIDLSFKGVASYIVVPVTGVGSIKTLTLEIAGQKLAGKGVVDFDDYPTAEELAAAKEGEDAYADLALTLDANASASVTVDFGSLKLDPHTATNVMFVVPAGITVSNEITLTADKGLATEEVLTKDALNKTVVLKRNAVQPICDDNGANWNFGFDGAMIIDDAYTMFGLEGAEVAALDFITYAYFAQAGSQDLTEDWEVVFAKFGADAYKMKAMILAEEIDLAEFNAESVFHKLGVYDVEQPKYAYITVYKNALKWYVENDYTIEPLAWGKNGIAVIGANAEPTVINGLTVMGNGITAGAALENIKFTNSFVIADNSDDAGFIAPTSKVAAVKDVVIGAGNVVNGLEADAAYSVGGIYGVYYGGATGVVVEALPEVIVREDATTYGLRPSDAVVMPTSKNGQVFGSVYAGTGNIAINLDTYKVASLATLPAVHTVSAANNNVIDFTTSVADAAINNVFAVNTAASKASVVLNNVSYWNGEIVAADADTYFTAEELAYAMKNGGNVVLTHNIDMLSKAINVAYIGSTLVNVSSAVDTVNSTKNNTVYHHFTIKNVKVNNTNDVVALFGEKSTIANITVSNVVLNATSTSAAHKVKNVGGLAQAGTAKNVVVDGLTINLGKKTADLANIGGVFATANAADIDNVEVTSFIVNHEAAEAPVVNAGVVAGTMNVALGKEVVTLGATKLTGAQSQKVYKTFSNAQRANFDKLATYANTNKYAYHYYPYGIINVTNAGFASNGYVNAVLNANAASVSVANMDKLAAGIVFTWTGDEAKAVSNTEGQYKDYTVKSNKAIGNGAAPMFWGFSATAPVAAK